ncbi:high chlorophyll fluorescence phenotype [Artemisia annua]|uniref:High chlorophyll fluorescence phenotype n=1 Tax=Artemisia annua TaxID=35608 RepID=A0A2U1L080_ARTAN|nr:high chlorophyll fluorescence phenotype [Artemisia annua]
MEMNNLSTNHGVCLRRFIDVSTRTMLTFRCMPGQVMGQILKSGHKLGPVRSSPLIKILQVSYLGPVRSSPLIKILQVSGWVKYSSAPRDQARPEVTSLQDSLNVEIPKEDLQIGFSRTGGNGGQNVNKVELLLLSLYVSVNSTCLSALLTEEKIQLANKINALSRLKPKLLVIAVEQRASEIKQIRGDTIKVDWGKQIRISPLPARQISKNGVRDYIYCFSNGW